MLAQLQINGNEVCNVIKQKDKAKKYSNYACIILDIYQYW